ncbi:nuclear transport factor 2 family protein [Neisseria perflava]|uniref:nuclear transport factor 2 family protein n=1 Tax=Neisseria perflava TaxID=33053 RepID=UPI00209D6503|nr:nuclear transport factor 2 family protein [Neisseria perflava]MCP1661237.1 ketosteroid isomerase-like protein [Neisseria perflava]MCP1773268.1 ketosteroid isomerase-like protein [Neisseria perflava]
MNVQQIQDRFDIKYVVDHFSNLADEKNVADQLPLFTEDAVVETYIDGELFASANGREAIGKVFSDYLALFDKVYHLNGQQTVELNGDSAEGVSYCQVALTHEKDGKPMMLSHYVRYNDSYRRVNGQWLIAKRVAHFLISEDRVMG